MIPAPPNLSPVLILCKLCPAAAPFPAAFPCWGTSPRSQTLCSLRPTWATAPDAEPLLLIKDPVLSPVPAPKFGLCLCSSHSGKKAQHAPGVGPRRGLDLLWLRPPEGWADLDARRRAWPLLWCLGVRVQEEWLDLSLPRRVGRE